MDKPPNGVTIIKGEGTYPTPEVRTILPSKRFLIKLLSGTIILWILMLVTFLGIVLVLVTILPRLVLTTQLRDLLVFVAVGFTVPIFVPVVILLPFYVKSMRYYVHGHEIEVHKGIFNKTIKHCPYRTVTNVSTTAGPLDRLFGIGSVNIETAGGSSSSLYEPVEKLEGIFVYHEIRDYIIRRLRDYNADQGREKGMYEPLPDDLHTLRQQSLETLQEIKNLLKGLKNERG